MSKPRSAIEALIDATVVCTRCGKNQCDCWIWREDLKRYIEKPDSLWNKECKNKRKKKNENAHHGKVK